MRMSIEMTGGGDPSDVRVLRCLDCGDTFPTHDADATCPSCGSDRVEPAVEPLL